MTGQSWSIIWNEHASDTYLYGSDVQINHKTDVFFENQLMPPGTVIKKWYSQTHFQKHHIEPSLPMIDGETEYELIPHIDYPQGGSCLIKLEFFDKYEESAGFTMIRNEPTRFHCPLKTYSYEMHLMNGGVTAFRFHSITIREVVDRHE